MPELPEVETVRCGIAPHIENMTIHCATVRCAKLRYPVDPNLNQLIQGQKVTHVSRRSKYLQLHFEHGGLLCHLGMSGSLNIVSATTAVKKHDHIDLHFDHCILRYNDPRRFGLMLFVDDFDNHRLLNQLGPEPLSPHFSTHYFYQKLQSQQCAIKVALMNGKNVVGVGNIYANEALFTSSINPLTPACELTRPQITKLVKATKQTLRRAIKAGGSTLKDFVDAEGKPGYFQQKHLVYGRVGQPCHHCQTAITQIRLGQRSTFYCPKCQP